jgi:hypothetical protein
LRVFNEDFTVAGRQADTRKNERVKPDQDVTQQTPVPEAIREAETEGAESTPD